ncbi:histone deacetylase family protein [Ponticaulis sp.]|uniref:histone deacetylase family protein n=1 Tax=Ponticaulis sp. TaxID=2020902 RepID=UPI000B6E9D2F|nr:histone deacetylase family protein [Ponticaulis sp.]MAI91208.1 acetylpolyamine amidohydrolase [Ponticaulis sp.]OUX98521.1 MAG: acetylpolyamine amidohydrolase [Hyphomonadaceae bacterium TMED5]|tara:strand:+ start:79453 stop:80481 length:1029 start_codon:yes stop_codon:yes gene_type:complete
MRAYQSPHCLSHDPKQYFRRGEIIDHPESDERHRVLLSAAKEIGCECLEPADFGEAPIRAVHSDDYVDFLASAWSRRDEIPGEPRDELLGNHFSKPQMHARPEGLLGQLGYYACDTSTPIREGSWSAIYWSAQCAIAAAEDSMKSGLSYALCRPPGHHAFADAAAGFCYLNNASIAAGYLRALTNDRVAVLDIDVHHGNGTQGIFYDQSKVLTVSIHCDTSDYYPFFAGYPDETGKGRGKGYNLNLPLPKGTGDEVFLNALKTACERIQKYQPVALVVALGLDAAKEDPIGAFEISKDGFAAAGTMISSLGLPTSFIQEGGYLCPALPENLKAFLTAVEAAA